MPPPLSSQTRFDIEYYLGRGDTVKDIVSRTGVTQQQISKMKRNLDEWGSVVAPYIKQGRPRLLTDAMEKTLTDWLDEKPLSYLFEMVYFLFDTYDGLTVSEPTIHRMLARCGWSHKKVSLSSMQKMI